jgi:hypothetical protein
MELLSNRYSGTSGSGLPTRRLRAIILRPSSAGCLLGEPGNSAHMASKYASLREARPDEATDPHRAPTYSSGDE